MTLKDLAARVALSSSAEMVSRAARQVRHWTQNDLLRPYGGKKETGTGTPRLYLEDPSVEIAVNLMELARYGATIDIMKPVADVLYDDDDEAWNSLFIATTDEGTAFMQVSWNVDRKTGAFTDARIPFFDTVDGGEPTGPDEKSASSILINLNKLFERIYSARSR